MTPGSRNRRTATGFAAVMIAALSGCHEVPWARIAPRPNQPQETLASAGRATLLPATVAMEPPSEMSSIEPVVPVLATEPAPRSIEPPPVPIPAPTPILDAALEKARGVEAVVAAEMARPASPPTLVPAPAPAPAPTPSPATPPAPADPPRAEPVAVAVAVATAPADPPRPEDLWRDGVHRLVSLARAHLEQPDGSGSPSPSPSPWGLRARVLAWLGEPEIDPDFGQNEADGVRAVLRALDDPPGEAPRRGDEVRAAVQILEDRAPLEIVDLRLCGKIERFGDFEPFDPPTRKAGQPVLIYAEVDGVHHEPTSAGYRTRVAARIEIFPEGGGPSIQSRPLGTAEEVCRRRRRDYYIPYKIFLPRPLPPGDYRLRLTLKDMGSDRSTSREVAFAIAQD